MIVKQFIKGAAKLYAVEAGEVQEAGKLRDGYEAGISGGLKVHFEGFRHGADEIHVSFVWKVGLGDVDVKARPVELGDR